MTMSITEPLRLAVGSHPAGSGKGCAMNLISWENGDTVITDLPDCTDPALARVVQGVNDHYCTHREVTRMAGTGVGQRWIELSDLLCPACSIDVLALAHRTVGTGARVANRNDVYLRMTLDECRDMLSPAPCPQALQILGHADRYLIDHERSWALEAAVIWHSSGYWAEDPWSRPMIDDSNAVDRVVKALKMISGMVPSTDPSPTLAIFAGTMKTSCATPTEEPWTSAERLANAHRIIDRFETYTGIRATAAAPEVTQRALASMRA